VVVVVELPAAGPLGPTSLDGSVALQDSTARLALP
jgi:hypothetical protein